MRLELSGSEGGSGSEPNDAHEERMQGRRQWECRRNGADQ